MKTEFKIDLKEHVSIREKNKKIFIWIFFTTVTIIFIAYYFIFDVESLYTLVFFITSFWVVSFFIYKALNKGLKDSSKQWHSYIIKLTQRGLVCEYVQPIYNEFEKVNWVKKETEIEWGNLGIISKPNILLFDKSMSYFERKILNRSIIRIPNEIENKNDLIESIKHFLIE